jgi:CubicO group peptidase (beta-lactamase class C family)
MRNYFLCILIMLSHFINAQIEKPYNSLILENKVDSLVRPYLDSEKLAGIAIAVFKDNEKVLLKSYGFADLEFDIKLPIDASFEIGSNTKQFTAAAIFQLVEKGKLSLEDTITKYIKFNTHGKTITIRHLLSHTSGIKGYTELPAFEGITMHPYDRDTILRIVEKEDLDFNPGDALIYSNTGFFILGLIIEKVTGLSYEEYIMSNLFEKAGMTNSYYCSESKVIKNKAHGYETGDKGLIHAGYLDHTWPYSAGSICSTAEDLVRWNNALHNGKILNEKLYKEFITPAILNDGTITHYAKGVAIIERNGRLVISHAGIINGFLSQNNYYPQDSISIVVLINSTGSISTCKIANCIADYFYGEASTSYLPYPGDITKLIGTYKGPGRGEVLSVRIIGNDSLLSIQIANNKPISLYYLHDDYWTDNSPDYWSGVSPIYRFRKTENEFKELGIDQIYGYNILKKE